MGRVAPFGTTLLAFAGVALFLYFLYIFYGFLFRAFQRVGFTQGEAGLILGGTLLLGFFNVPLFLVGDWTVGVNLGGAVLPVVIVILILRRVPGIALEAVAGVVFVALASYAVSSVTPEGIVAVFPLWIVPPLVAALFSMASFWREEAYSAPLAYVAGTLGALIGADFARIGEFLAQTPPEVGQMASIGGASVFDMVYLTGIIAVGLDMIVFRERRRSAVEDGETGGLVFTMTTPPEVVRDYVPGARKGR